MSSNGSLILGLLSETSLHVGAGRANGPVDLPVAREAATDYPFVPGSGLKGALRDAARLRLGTDDGASSREPTDRLFGVQENAGALLIGDARLLLLPVRSLTGAYRWVTCPHVLERFGRDRHRVGVGAELTVPSPSTFGALGRGEGRLHLEERSFTFEGAVPDPVVEALASLVLHTQTRGRLEDQLVIVSDDAFAWFSRYALDVRARNVLDETNKTSKNLWYEESLPPDTLLYSVVGNRPTAATADGLSELETLFTPSPYLQVGGNETVGHGWCAVSLLRGQP